MHKVLLNLVLLATILVGAWAVVNMKFDIRRFASSEPCKNCTSPTPSPVLTNAPQITTTSLPMGMRGLSYSATIRGIDPDFNDSLNMNISSLPQGLTRGPCSLSNPSKPVSPAQLDCGITGVPTSSGSYSVNVTLTDRDGHSVSRTFPLTIGPTPIPVTPSPSPVACQVILSPSTISLISGGSTAPISATVGPTGGGGFSISAVTFISGNSKVSVVPITDTSAPFVTSVRAQSQIIPTAYLTNVRATALLSDGRICQTTTATDTDVSVR